ncbi:MAG: MotA/TolQ/ExbB proton channel family protein [Fibrobacteres bacterium]|nr:MotA/TolQ/ExbB proton channel family protein [Fibrobacterota bacterium]
MELILKGFQGEGKFYMSVILCLGIISLAIIAERFYYIYVKSSAGRANFMRNIAQLLQTGRVAEAGHLAASQNFPLAKIISAVLQNKAKGQAAIEKAVDEVYLTEAPRINRYLNLLPAFANIAMLCGLLGTIFGLILAFDAVANLPAAQRPQALANGISVVMVNTWTGLATAIPILLLHGLLSMQSERLQEEMEEKAVKVMNLL